jgi:hypothetical protein
MIKSLIFTAAAFTLSACSNLSPMPAPAKSWAQHTGQIQASGGTRNIVGEITIRSDRENFLAEISKGPGLQLLTIYAQGTQGEVVRIRGPLAGGSYEGRAVDAPAKLQAWAALPGAFHSAQARARREFKISHGKEIITCRLNPR